MKIEEAQELRKKIIDELDEIKHEAYSGLTCIEYDAINVLRCFIKARYMETLYFEEKDNG